MVDLEVTGERGKTLLVGAWGEDRVGFKIDAANPVVSAVVSIVVSKGDAIQIRDWLTARLAETLT